MEGNNKDFTFRVKMNEHKSKNNQKLIDSGEILNRKQNLNHIYENHQILKCVRTKYLDLLNQHSAPKFHKHLYYGVYENPQKRYSFIMSRK